MNIFKVIREKGLDIAMCCFAVTLVLIIVGVVTRNEQSTTECQLVLTSVPTEPGQYDISCQEVRK